MKETTTGTAPQSEPRNGVSWNLAKVWAGFAGDPIHVIAVIVFALNVFLVSSTFFPNLHEINAWDEAGYVYSGRVLLDGQWPSFSSGPLVAVLYALTSFAYLESPFWLVHSTTLGRILLFALVWFGSYAVARRLGGTVRPLFMVGLLFVGALMVSLLSFPSDPLYVAFAALSLASAMAYLSSGRRKHLGLASLFIGLAALSRNDGLVLGIALIVATPFLVRSPGSRWKATAIAAGPFALLVGGYVLFFGLRTGDFALGTLARTYDNFEAGHQVITAGAGQVNPVIEAKLAAREVFGTPEENDHSVFRAIARNPRVYLQRLRAIVPLLPGQMLSAYGVRLAAPLFLFAARGFWELFRQRRFRLLGLFALWFVPLLSGFLITLFRTGHLRFPFYVVFALAATGMVASVRNIRSKREQAFLVVAFTAMAIYGWVDAKPAIVYGAVVTFTALALGLLVISYWHSQTRKLVVPGMLLLAGALLLHGDYSGPKTRVLGQFADEQGVIFLAENFDPGTPVAAGSPGPVYSAGMRYMGLTSLDVPRTDTAGEFLIWMKGQGIVAIYVDASLSSDNPFFWNQISSLVGSDLERVFAADEGDIQVLRLRD
jgi:hypothetical protein